MHLYIVCFQGMLLSTVTSYNYAWSGSRYSLLVISILTNCSNSAMLDTLVLRNFFVPAVCNGIDSSSFMAIINVLLLLQHYIYISHPKVSCTCSQPHILARSAIPPRRCLHLHPASLRRSSLRPALRYCICRRVQVAPPPPIPLTFLVINQCRFCIFHVPNLVFPTR